MNFDLRRPCPRCPFRTDCPGGWLGERRAREIATEIHLQDKTFACHETVVWDDEGEQVSPERQQHCAGALIVSEHAGSRNAMQQISERLGLRDPARLDLGSPVFSDFEAFVQHHGRP